MSNNQNGNLSYNSNPHTGPDKGEVFTKVSFKPKEQLDTFQNPKANSTTRFGQSQGNENRLLNQSSQTVRPQLRRLGTQTAEEGAMRGKYFETLDEGSGFNKKQGYFTEYVRQNKMISDQYKVKKSPSNGHSRYISKPVFFTTLKSKNKLTDYITSDHSELLEVSKLGSPQNGKSALNISEKLLKQEILPSPINKADEQSPSFGPISPSFQTRPKTKSQDFAKHRTYTPNASPKKFHRDSSPHGGSNANFTGAFVNFNTLSTITGPSDFNLLEEDEKSQNARAIKHQSTLDELKSPQNVQKLTRYNTLQVTRALATRCAERSKIDPNKFMQQKNNKDYLRQTSMAFDSANKHRKSQIYHISPKIARTIPTDSGYKELNTLEEIEKFEEGISGWTKSVPNFGKQRWTYDKSWEFRII